MTNLRTTIHAYYFNLDKSEDAAAYDKLRAEMKAQGVKCFETHGGGSHHKPELDGLEIELETKHLFDNQWNTAPIGDAENGLRVFDWAQDYNGPLLRNKKIKRGHYLRITDAMKAARADRVKCGYCGHQQPKSNQVFCDKCLDSQYLNEDNLPLLRLRGVNDGLKKSPPLTTAELAELLPVYVQRQTTGNDSRNAKRIARERERLKKELDTTIEHKKREYAGFIWLIDNDLASVAIDNCIYYKHRGVFSFGWKREGVAETVASRILEKISEFPFPYEIKVKGGKTYSHTEN